MVEIALLRKVAKNLASLYMVSNADINGDGIEDLIVLINTKAIQLSKTATEAELLGQTITGMGWRRAFSAGRAATAHYPFSGIRAEARRAGGVEEIIAE